MDRLGRIKPGTVLLGMVLVGLFVALVAALVSLDPGGMLRGTAGSRGTVEVVAFSGWAEQGFAHLRWQTAAEVGISGFNLYRSGQEAGPYEPLNSAPIPSQAAGDGSAIYDFLDRGVIEGEVYHYKLEPLDGEGRLGEHGPVSVQIWPISSLPPSARHRVVLPAISRNP